MSIETIHSWRELDDAIADANSEDVRAHSSLVFRGLARSSYSKLSPPETRWSANFTPSIVTANNVAEGPAPPARCSFAPVLSGAAIRSVACCGIQR